MQNTISHFTAVLAAGKNLYVKKKPEQKVITRTLGCIFVSIVQSCIVLTQNYKNVFETINIIFMLHISGFKYALRAKVTSTVPPKTHWLDNAKGKYTESEISDTRSVLDVICVFIAYPVFWSLYTQSVQYLLYL